MANNNNKQLPFILNTHASDIKRCSVKCEQRISAFLDT